MTENSIIISNINDFIFCPISIYFHNLMGNANRMMSQSECQINGTHAHRTIENGTYSSKKDVLQGIDVYCEKYDLTGKIDIFDMKKGVLTERKKKISIVFDGQLFQLYAQYFALQEMGYLVKQIRLHSMDDNKIYDVALPDEDIFMKNKFENTISNMRSFDPEGYIQTNSCKCSNCIYEPMCGNSCLEVNNDVD